MFSFVKNRFYFYIFSAFLLLFSLCAPKIFGLNEGIDLTGGIQIEYSVQGGDVSAIMDQTRTKFIDEAKNTLTEEQQKIITDAFVYRVSGTDHFIVEAGIHESVASGEDESERLKKIEDTKAAFVAGLAKIYQQNDSKIQQTRYVNIGASLGEYIKSSGYLTLTIAIIGISIYIMYAFWGSIPGRPSWPFALVIGVSLVHDVIITFGLYVGTSFFFPEFKIDTFFITAILTVLGYSINDSVVIMDRIRSTIKYGKGKSKHLGYIIDEAVHGVMRRSIFTSVTILIVLCSVFAFGPDSIRGFMLALIFGTIIGTYSSICIAAPLLIDMTKKEKN